jgi:hypothetical protein
MTGSAPVTAEASAAEGRLGSSTIRLEVAAQQQGFAANHENTQGFGGAPQGRAVQTRGVKPLLIKVGVVLPLIRCRS